DLLGVPVVRPRQLESTAQGAAYLAGLAVGYWQNEDEIRSLWKADRAFEPAMDEDRRAVFLAGWAKALGRAKGWVAPKGP
ncbi:MAG: glycerol kinase, partial [Betaproteobacteria bacterium]